MLNVHYWGMWYAVVLLKVLWTQSLGFKNNVYFNVRKKRVHYWECTCCCNISTLCVNDHLTITFTSAAEWCLCFAWVMEWISRKFIFLFCACYINLTVAAFFYCHSHRIIILWKQQRNIEIPGVIVNLFPPLY